MSVRTVAAPTSPARESNGGVLNYTAELQSRESTLVLLLIGGLAYTAGVIFYAWERLPYNHAVWHLFVLAGSTFQFLAVLLYVLPSAGPV